MNRRLTKRIALTLVAGALAAPAAQAGTTPKYDGYKSSYPQLHELGVAAAVPDPDLKSSYPQLHQIVSGVVRTPAVEAGGSSGVDWVDAMFGALVGAAATALLASAALMFRRHRLPALH